MTQPPVAILIAWAYMIGGPMHDKNTCARTLVENVGGGAYMRRGAYLWDTTVYTYRCTLKY